LPLQAIGACRLFASETAVLCFSDYKPSIHPELTIVNGFAGNIL